MAGRDFTSSSNQIGFIKNSGGLNSTASPIDVDDNQATDLRNIDFDVFGAFRQRNGFRHLNAGTPPAALNSGASVTSLHFFENRTSDVLVSTVGDKLFTTPTLDYPATWTDNTGGLTITAGNNNLFQWKTFNNAMYGTNNLDLPIKLDDALTATNFTVPTGLTKAKWIESFNNYMFLANSEISGTRRSTRLNWSSLDDAETWDAADFNEIGLDDGEEITGLKKLGDRLCIFKERSIYIALFTGDRDIPFTFIKTASDVGAVSGYSLQEVKNGIVFLAFDGIYFFDGFNSTKLSDRISNTLTGTFSENRYEFATSAYQRSKNRYWLMFSDANPTHDTVITWDAFNNAFSIYKGINANALTTLYDDGEERIYFGDYDGYVYQADREGDVNDVDSDNDPVAIETFYKTKWFNFGDIVLNKGVAHSIFYFNFDNAQLKFSYSYDLEEGNDFTQTFNLAGAGSLWDDPVQGVWDVSEWGSSGGGFFRVDHAGRGRLIRLIFQNDNVNESFQINAFGFFVHLETHV